LAKELLDGSHNKQKGRIEKSPMEYLPTKEELFKQPKEFIVLKNKIHSKRK
jgi:hypothetical protein